LASYDNRKPALGIPSAGLDSSFDALFITPTYTPDTMILGARPSFSLSFAPGYNATSATVAVGLDVRRQRSHSDGATVLECG